MTVDGGLTLDLAAMADTWRGRSRAFAKRHSVGFWQASRSGCVGLGIVVTVVVIALLVPLIAPHDPLEIFQSAILQPPSWRHLAGTDSNGMDVFWRTVYAARVDLLIAFSAVAISIVLGLAIGLVVTFRGGWPESLVLRLLDVIQAFPVLILALAIVAVLNASVALVILIIGILDTPIFIRLVHAQVIRLRGATFVDSARAVGNPTHRILWRHLLPNVVSPVLVETSTRVSWAVKTTASLAFVGVGVQVPTAEWGAMMRQGAGGLIGGQWWMALTPGIAIIVLTFGINLLSDGLRDYLDPRHG
jgi:peptide/nickel transport system permease protein